MHKYSLDLFVVPNEKETVSDIRKKNCKELTAKTTTTVDDKAEEKKKSGAERNMSFGKAYSKNLD